MRNSREQLICQNMKEIQDRLFPDLHYLNFDIHELRKKTRLEIEDDILRVYPDIQERLLSASKEYDISTHAALEIFYIGAYCHMIKFIQKKQLEKMDEENPDLYDTIERIKKL